MGVSRSGEWVKEGERWRARLSAEWFMMKKDGSPPTTCGDDGIVGEGSPLTDDEYAIALENY
jgi:hypothetical protein